MKRIAILGAGPAGLVTARYLKSEGLEPVIFDRANKIGGQWSGDTRYSGTWAGMHTNTSRTMTAFSDLPHPDGVPVFPSREQVGQYLRRYAERFELIPHLRLETGVERVDMAQPYRCTSQQWLVCTSNADGRLQLEQFDGVVVASGWNQTPRMPSVPGLNSFTGSAGAMHTNRYRGVEPYRGKTVVVGGGNISSLEIASALAMGGAGRVIVTQRKQRYVLPKLRAGVPMDQAAFTRFAALAGETFPIEATAAALKDLVLSTNGHPETYGAKAPADNILEAGLTMSPYFLTLVAEGRIEVRPWIDRVQGDLVWFQDGSIAAVDGILFGTGYETTLPYLSHQIRHKVNLGGGHLNLDRYTFHPDLPGLAFVGPYESVGPFFPVAELQARWVAYTMSGALPSVSREEMERGQAAVQARKHLPPAVPMHDLAMIFARAAKVEPHVERWPQLAKALMFGPLVPVSFRLEGRDALPDAAERFMTEARMFRAITDAQFTHQEMEQMRMLETARDAMTACAA